jgi:hypothetical protein
MDYGFQLPDEVFAVPQDERRLRLRGLGRVFVLDESRGFVRIVLPVGLDHGSVRFGIWLEIPPEQAEHALQVWETPAYAAQSYVGTVANFLPPWGDALLGAEASARPISANELPVVDGGEEVVRSLLTRTWPRADVVAALPGLGHAH